MLNRQTIIYMIKHQKVQCDIIKWFDLSNIQSRPQYILALNREKQQIITFKTLESPNIFLTVNLSVKLLITKNNVLF